MKTLLRFSILFYLLFPVLISAQGVWTQKANYLGTRRFDFIGYALNNKGYIGTGTLGGINSFLADWQEFDPVLNTWTQKAPLPMPFKGGVGFVAGNYGYATTGANDATYIFDTYEYNDIGNNWSAKAPFNAARLYGTGIGAGNYGYIVGGYDGGAMPMNDCWEYNQPANTWTQRVSLPVSKARYYATGFSVSGKVFIFGGTDGNNYLNDLWEFNPANNTWIQKASLPGPGRQQSDAFVINGNAYVVGGLSAAGGTLKEVWKYNPLSNLWTQLANFPGATGPGGGIGFTINGLGYVVCGNGTAECWEFNPQITGISDQGTTAQKITVFPNPASTFISLNIPAGITCKTAFIYYISGKIVLNETTLENSGTTIDISCLQPGFYILKATTNSGLLLSSSFIKFGN